MTTEQFETKKWSKGDVVYIDNKPEKVVTICFQTGMIGYWNTLDTIRYKNYRFCELNFKTESV